jgi:hypothetical protein
MVVPDMSKSAAAPSPTPNFNDAPWTEFTSFSKERLEIVGESLRDARRRAVLRFEPDEGENSWSLGCSAYVRQMKAIRNLADKHDWIGILKEQAALCFSFTIGEHAVRYFRGDIEETPSRYLSRSHGELKHIQYVMEFFRSDIVREYIFRIAIDTDGDGYATDIYLVKMDKEGALLGSYLIPKRSSTNVVPLQTKPVDLPPAHAVPLRAEKQNKKQSSDEIGDVTKNAG